jgi:hypothetical protein
MRVSALSRAMIASDAWNASGQVLFYRDKHGKAVRKAKPFEVAEKVKQ